MLHSDFSVVTQRSSCHATLLPQEERCMTTLKTAVKQTETRRHEKHILETAPPPLSQGLDDRPPLISRSGSDTDTCDIQEEYEPKKPVNMQGITLE